jgi:acetolactate synthase-1/2/3 large subunit
VLNAAAALLTAQSTSSPVLCLAGEIPSVAIGRGFHCLHEMRDQRLTLRSIVKWDERVDSPDMALPLTEEAIRQATGGRPGVAAIEIPMDILGLPVAADTRMPTAAPAVAAEIDPQAIKAAAKIIAGSRCPMILVGGGAIGARAEVGELARLLGAPVVSFRAGKGIVSDRDALSFNVIAGFKLWEEVDTVIAIGTRLDLAYVQWGGMERKKLIRIDIETEAIDRYAVPEAAIAGDAKAALALLLPAVAAKAGKPSPANLEHLAQIKQSAARDIATIQPQVAYLQAIRDVLPDNGIFVDEVTQVGYTSWYGFPCYQPRRFINSGYQGNLGYGLATAIGAKVANPDAQVVSISGDGGFMFNVQELATAVRERLNLVAIVFNNNMFGNVARDQHNLFEGRVIGTNLANPDFPALAESFGAAGQRVTTPEALRPALEKAFARSGPTVIEVPLDAVTNPWPLMVPNGYMPYLAKVAATAPGKR